MSKKWVLTFMIMALILRLPFVIPLAKAMFTRSSLSVTPLAIGAWLLGVVITYSLVIYNHRQKKRT